MDLFEFDAQYDIPLLCGVDEAGRGPLAGDVYAGACILPKDCVIEGLNDSKKLTPKKREKIYNEITQKAVSWAVGTATVAEIEEFNILGATFSAMQRAIAGLSITPQLILVDGSNNPKLSDENGGRIHSSCVIKGDGTSACIAAASVLAKVSRDRYMERLAAEYPEYQFEKHKGYGTALHYEMLDKYGVSAVHRPSFLKKYLNEGKKNVSDKNKSVSRGKTGEDAACRFLFLKGFKILDRNYRSSWGEIDIVAEKGDIIAFVEVKAREHGSVVSPVEAVSPSKREKLIKTAYCYLDEHKTPLQPRFDVAEVFLDANGKKSGKVNLIENAFGEKNN